MTKFHFKSKYDNQVPFDQLIWNMYVDTHRSWPPVEYSEFFKQQVSGVVEVHMLDQNSIDSIEFEHEKFLTLFLMQYGDSS